MQHIVRYFSFLLLFSIVQKLSLAGIVAVSYNDPSTSADRDSNLYSLNPTTGAAVFIGRTGGLGFNSLAANSMGELFSVESSSTNTTSKWLYRIDITTAQSQQVFLLPSTDIRALAFSPFDMLYAVRDGGTLMANDHIERIDIATQSVTRLGTTIASALQSLDFSPDGVLYGWDSASMGLVTINTIDATVADVNPDVGTDVVLQSIAFDSTGSLYGASQSALYSIDRVSGTLTQIGSSSFLDIRGIEFLPSAIPEPTCTVLCLFAINLFSFRRNQCCAIGVHIPEICR